MIRPMKDLVMMTVMMQVARVTVMILVTKVILSGLPEGRKFY